MEKHVLFWIPVGFDRYDPSRTDFCSREALSLAVERMKELRQEGKTVWLNFPHSIVRDKSGKHKLFDAMQRDSVVFGHVSPQYIILEKKETTGSPTDGLTVAEFARDNPDTVIEVFTVSPQMGAYCKVMYQAIARWVVGCNLQMEIVTVADAETTWLHRSVYRALRYATLCVAWNGTLFRVWYNFLDHRYQKRKHGFRHV